MLVTIRASSAEHPPRGDHRHQRGDERGISAGPCCPEEMSVASGLFEMGDRVQRGRESRRWRGLAKVGKLSAMQYRSFFKSHGLSISTLGFGCMRLPTVGGDLARIEEETATRLVHQAIAAGVNYFDTAWPYQRQQSESFLGRAVKGRCHAKRLATKPLVKAHAHLVG